MLTPHTQLAWSFKLQLLTVQIELVFQPLAKDFSPLKYNYNTLKGNHSICLRFSVALCGKRLKLLVNRLQKSCNRHPEQPQSFVFKSTVVLEIVARFL